VELLIVVAIISITTAVAIPAVASFTEGMRMQELDTTAREIFAAAQNRAYTMKATGELAAFAGEIEDIDPSKTYIVSGEKVAEFFAPQLSAVALDGEYLVELNPATGQIHSVFFSEGETPEEEWLGYTDPAARAEHSLGYYAADATPPTTPATGKLTPTISVVNGEELVLTLRCPEISSLDDISATLTLSSGDAKQVFTTEALPPTLVPAIGGGSFEVKLTLAKIESGVETIKFADTCPDLAGKVGEIITANFVIDQAGLSGKANEVKFRLTLAPPKVTVGEEGHDLLPPANEFKDKLKQKPKTGNWNDIGVDEVKKNQIYFVYFEQYKDGTFGYHFANESLDGDTTLVNASYPKLKYANPINRDDKANIIHRVGYGIVAPKDIPLGNAVTINGNDIHNDGDGINLLYDDDIKVSFDNDTTDDVNPITLWLYPIDTSHGAFYNDVLTILYKYKIENDNPNPEKTFYADTRFAQAFSKNSDLGATSGKPLVIRTMEHLQNAEYIRNKYFEITHDIDVVTEEILPILEGGKRQRYLSTFDSNSFLDGNDHTITGLQATLIGNINGTVTDLNVNGSEFAMSSEYPGIFVANLYGVVENCTVTDSTISTDLNWFQPGAFVGTNNGAITNCSVSGITMTDTSPPGSPDLFVSFYYRNRYNPNEKQSGSFKDCYVYVISELGEKTTIWDSDA
jgi:type II secretory pathway pseudopilin PulG